MDVFTTLTTVRSAADAADAAEAMEAIQKNNAACAAKRAGRYDEAIRLHTEAIQSKVRLFGEQSVQAALSFHNLGGAYLEAGRIEEAADAFAKSLVVRDDQEFGGLEIGPRGDAAATRDNMARVLEARGDFPGAREMRLKGADKGRTICGSDDVSLASVMIPNSLLLKMASVGTLLIVVRSPTTVRVSRRWYAVPHTVEKLCCVPFCLLLQPSVSEEGLGQETQAPLQGVHGFDAGSCQHS